MEFPVIITGENIRKQLKPFWIYNNQQWNEDTQKIQDLWQKWDNSRPFMEFAKSHGYLQREKLPSDPVLRTTVSLVRNGETRCFWYGNPHGHWTHYDKETKYEMIPLWDKTYAWKTRAKFVDLEWAIEEAIESYAQRWHSLRKKMGKNPQINVNFSAALRMDKNEYIEKRVTQYLVPDALIHNGQWISFWKEPCWKTLRRYKSMLEDLDPETSLTVLACHG